MCGIFGIYKHPGATGQDLRPLVEKLLVGVEVRGKDACGVAYVLGDTLYYDKDPITPSEYVSLGRVMSVVDKDFTMLIGHSRHATQGSPKDNRNNHPLINEEGGMIYGFVHNGMVQDTYAGSRKLLAEVDTEYIRATVTDRLDEGKSFEDAIFEGVETLRGSMTTAWISPTNPNMYFTRKGNPLCLAHCFAEKITVFASTREILVAALDEFVKKAVTVFPMYSVWEPEDDRLVILMPDVIRKRTMKHASYVYKSWSSSRWDDYDDVGVKYPGIYKQYEEKKKSDTLRSGTLDISDDTRKQKSSRFISGDVVAFERGGAPMLVAGVGVGEVDVISSLGARLSVLASELIHVMHAYVRAQHNITEGDHVVIWVGKKRAVGVVSRVLSRKKLAVEVIAVNGSLISAQKNKITCNRDLVVWLPSVYEISNKDPPRLEFGSDSLRMSVYRYGKETILGDQLASVLYVTSEGNILVNTKPLEMVMTHEARRKHRVVPGDTVVFKREEQICVGRVRNRNETTGILDVEVDWVAGARSDTSLYMVHVTDVTYFPTLAEVETDSLVFYGSEHWLGD